MKKMKVMTVLGTRPEIIRLSRVIFKLEKYFEHTLVHTGQNYDYELSEIFFEELGLRKPNIFLGAAGKTASVTIANVIEKIDKVFYELNPDALLILGDTNSSLVSISAKRHKIPIFHMEAGNRSFDYRVPEEINRRIVDHISDINLPYSSIAREYLLSEGLPADRVIKTGSPMYEVLQHYMPKIKQSNVLSRLHLMDDKYFLVSLHREENIEPNIQFSKLIDMMNTLAVEHDLPIIVSTHPRTKKHINSKNISLHSNLRLLKPLSFFDYVSLQTHAKAVLSDSGTITEEASILNFPALNIRETHERPEGFEEGAVIMAGLEPERIRQALKILEHQFRRNERDFRIVSDYNVPNVSEKIVRIIQSYTNYVNQVVWKKN